MNYKFLTPNGQAEKTLSTQFGNIICVNGKEYPESYLTKTYPEYFFPIPEPNDALVEKWEKVIESPVNKDAKANLLESKETPIKRGPGRPKKTFQAKG